MSYQPKAQSTIPIHIVTQLWGESYVNLFGNYVIDSLMCDGNLPALKVFKNIIYEIYTTESDKFSLQANANFKHMVEQTKNWITFRFIIIESNKDNYELMSACHRQAIASADLRHAAILFLQPDVIVGDGSLRTVRDKLLAGKRLVMSPGLRVAREVMEEKIRAYAQSANTKKYPTSRELVAFAVANLHPISKALLWRNGKINAYCSHLYWHIGNSSLYARCAHMHPLMVYPRKPECGFYHTIDWDYFYRACPNVKDWFITSSSDEVCLIELSSSSKFADSITWSPAEPKTITRFLNVASRPPHFKLLNTPYLFIGCELTAGDWVQQHKEGGEILKKAVRAHKSIFRKPIIWLMRFKNWLITIKISAPALTNRYYRMLFFSIYYPLRFLWRLFVLMPRKRKNTVLNIVANNIGGKGMPESFVVQRIKKVKNNFVAIKTSNWVLNSNICYIAYFSIYYPSRVLWRQKLGRMIIIRFVYLAEFIVYKLTLIIKIMVKKMLFFVYKSLRFQFRFLKWVTKLIISLCKHINRKLIHFFKR